MKEYAVRTWGIWVPEPQENFRPEIHEIIQYGEDEIGCIAVAADFGDGDHSFRRT